MESAPTPRTAEKVEKWKLTMKLCKEAKAGAYERIELRDDGTNGGTFGLSLRVSGPTGKRANASRVWHLTYRVRELDAKTNEMVWVQRRMKLGDFPELELDAARKLAARHKAIAQEGRDPQMVLRAEAAKFKAEQDALANRATVEKVLRKYVTEGMRGRSPDHVTATTRMFERYVFPKIGNNYVADIQPDTISKLVSGIIGKHGERGVIANRLLTGIKAAFNWAVREQSSWLKVNPADKLKKPVQEASESRALSDNELPAIWAAAGKLGYPCGDALKIMLLTGQRRGDVGNMRFKHLDLDKGTWTQPAWIDRALGKGGNKARRQHCLTLPPAAVAILKRLRDEMATHPGRAAGDDHVFVEKSGKPLQNNWHWAQPKLRELANEIAGKELDHWEVEWTRHTVRTALSAKPISATEAVGELILNHAVADKLRKTYGQHDYIEEMAEALEKWERKLLAIVEPGERKVVKLRG